MVIREIGTGREKIPKEENKLRIEDGRQLIKKIQKEMTQEAKVKMNKSSWNELAIKIDARKELFFNFPQKKILQR